MALGDGSLQVVRMAAGFGDDLGYAMDAAIAEVPFGTPILFLRQGKRLKGSLPSSCSLTDTANASQYWRDCHNDSRGRFVSAPT